MRWCTCCNTKLCFALAMRDVAAAHPALDVVVLHPQRAVRETTERLIHAA